jgi:hypothetical protein
LTRKVYGFDFENWYLKGYWGNGYIPYSLLNGDVVIANIFSRQSKYFDCSSTECSPIITSIWKGNRHV